MEITSQEFKTLRHGDEDAAKELLEKLFERSIHLATEQALRSLPNVVQSLITQVSSIKEAKDKFYAENKDLANNRELVAKTMQKLEAENPGLTLEAMLQKLAPEVRKIQTTMNNLPPAQGRPKPETLDHLAGMFEGE